MEPQVVRSLEREIERAIIQVIGRLGLKKLPILPSQDTMRKMAQAAVAVYKGEVNGPENQTTNDKKNE